MGGNAPLLLMLVLLLGCMVTSSQSTTNTKLCEGPANGYCQGDKIEIGSAPYLAAFMVRQWLVSSTAEKPDLTFCTYVTYQGVTMWGRSTCAESSLCKDCLFNLHTWLYNHCSYRTYGHACMFVVARCTMTFSSADLCSSA